MGTGAYRVHTRYAPVPIFVELPMGWVFLEVLLALAIAVGIVWWTLPRKPKKAPDAAAAAKDEPPQS